MFTLFFGRPIARATLTVEKPPKIEEQGNGRLLLVMGFSRADMILKLQFVTAFVDLLFSYRSRNLSFPHGIALLK